MIKLRTNRAVVAAMMLGGWVSANATASVLALDNCSSGCHQFVMLWLQGTTEAIEYSPYQGFRDYVTQSPDGGNLNNTGLDIQFRGYPNGATLCNQQATSGQGAGRGIPTAWNVRTGVRQNCVPHM
jgi:hypothetical protein